MMIKRLFADLKTSIIILIYRHLKQLKKQKKALFLQE